MGAPPRVPLVLLLLLAAERTARGTFPEEPGPIAVAPEDCEYPHRGAGWGSGCCVHGQGGDTARHGERMGFWVALG